MITCWFENLLDFPLTNTEEKLVVRINSINLYHLSGKPLCFIKSRIKDHLTVSKSLEKSSLRRTLGEEEKWQKEVTSWVAATQSRILRPRMKADCCWPTNGEITDWRRLARTLVMILKVVLRRPMGLNEDKLSALEHFGRRKILA